MFPSHDHDGWLNLGEWTIALDYILLHPEVEFNVQFDVSHNCIPDDWNAMDESLDGKIHYCSVCKAIFPKHLYELIKNKKQLEFFHNLAKIKLWLDLDRVLNGDLEALK